MDAQELEIYHLACEAENVLFLYTDSVCFCKIRPGIKRLHSTFWNSHILVVAGWKYDSGSVKLWCAVLIKFGCLYEDIKTMFSLIVS